MQGTHRWLAAGLMCMVWGCASRPYTEESVIKAQRTAPPSSTQAPAIVFVPPPVAAQSTNSSPQNYTSLNLKHWIARLSDGGKVVALEDGSVWEISPAYRSRTLVWAITQEIEVTAGVNPQYPYQLSNAVTKDVVDGQYKGGTGPR
jgi:hypothetical protein